MYNELYILSNFVISTASDKVDQQDIILKKGKTVDNNFNEVQKSQNNNSNNQNKGSFKRNKF